MKAAVLERYGGPVGIEVATVQDPSPGPGEVLIRVRAAALNHRDLFVMSGRYGDVRLPCILGSDGAGEVAALGAGVDGPAIGTPVVINPMLNWGSDERAWGEGAAVLGAPTDGTFAQYIAVAQAQVFPKPAHLDFRSAAALPLAGLTAYRALRRGRVYASDTLLLTGIGSGVQLAVLGFARDIGCTIVVTSSSDEKLERAKELGAHEVVNYVREPDWDARIAKLGITVAIDSSGGDTLARVLTLVRTGGRVVIYGGTTGNATIRPRDIFWSHLDVLGTSLGSPKDFAEMLELTERGYTPIIDSVVALDEVVPAAERLASGKQFGKVVLECT